MKHGDEPDISGGAPYALFVVRQVLASSGLIYSANRTDIRLGFGFRKAAIASLHLNSPVIKPRIVDFKKRERIPAAFLNPAGTIPGLPPFICNKSWRAVIFQTYHKRIAHLCLKGPQDEYQA